MTVRCLSSPALVRIWASCPSNSPKKSRWSGGSTCRLSMYRPAFHSTRWRLNPQTPRECWSRLPRLGSGQTTKKTNTNVKHIAMAYGLHSRRKRVGTRREGGPPRVPLERSPSSFHRLAEERTGGLSSAFGSLGWTRVQVSEVRLKYQMSLKEVLVVTKLLGPG
jgi:hypothetical protein